MFCIIVNTPKGPSPLVSYSDEEVMQIFKTEEEAIAEGYRSYFGANYGFYICDIKGNTILKKERLPWKW